MRELYVLGIYASFFIVGAIAPFVLTLGYLWVDTFYPQLIAPGLLGNVPVSLIMAVAALGAYFLMDRRSPPRITAIAVLCAAMAIWVTLTATWAVAPDYAWVKWNWAFKSIMFSVFLPFVLRSRVQIEAFITVYVFAAALHILPIGLKTLVSGGGYGVQLGILGNNAGLAESSEVATAAIMFIPVLLWLAEHSILVPQRRLRKAVFYGMAAASVFGAIGTFARTALVGFAVAGSNMWMQSRRKLLLGTGMLFAVAVMAAVTSSQWTQRIETVDDPTHEASALTRLLVWQWTLEFAQTHPFGGGFSSFVVNEISVPADATPDGVAYVQHGRAFHSVYFEMLGEHGYPGLAMFLTIAGLSVWSYTTTRRRTRDIPELQWCRNLAGALRTALLTLLACGAFVGIGFQPMFWYMFALSICLREYVRRCMAPVSAARVRALAPAYSRAVATSQA